MMSLDSHVTLAVVFSFIAMIGQAVGIWANFHSRNKEGTEKEVKVATLFSRLDTKLDFLSQRVESINRSVEKQDSKLDEISIHLSRNDERLNHLDQKVEDISKRLDRLEGNG